MPQGFEVLAVSMDDTAAPVRRTVRRLQLDFPVVMGDAQLGDEYGGLLGLPVTYLIDREGKIHRRVQRRFRSRRHGACHLVGSSSVMSNREN